MTLWRWAVDVHSCDILMPAVAPMVTAVVAGPAARLEVQGPLGGPH